MHDQYTDYAQLKKHHVVGYYSHAKKKGGLAKAARLLDECGTSAASTSKDGQYELIEA